MTVDKLSPILQRGTTGLRFCHEAKYTGSRYLKGRFNPYYVLCQCSCETRSWKQQMFNRHFMHEIISPTGKICRDFFPWRVSGSHKTSVPRLYQCMWGFGFFVFCFLFLKKKKKSQNLRKETRCCQKTISDIET